MFLLATVLKMSNKKLFRRMYTFTMMHPLPFEPQIRTIKVITQLLIRKFSYSQYDKRKINL